MKIASVVPWYPSYVGDEKILAIFYHRQAKKLVEMGHQVIIITIKRQNMPDYEIMDGVEIFRFNTVIFGKFRYPIPNLVKLTILIIKLHKEYNFDIIEFATQDFLTSIPALYIKKIVRIPVIVTVNGLPGISWFAGDKLIDRIGYFYTKLIGLPIIRSADGVRLLNGQMIKDCKYFVNNNKNHVQTIHRGVDSREFYPCLNRDKIRKDMQIAENMAIILFIGRLIEMKGIQYLINAFVEILPDYPNLKLLLVGDGDHKKILENYSTKMTSNIIFAGFQENVFKYMCIADFFILPSLCEGCPNVVLEAMSCGKPVIATQVGAVPEIIENNISGLIVKPQDVKELKTAIIKLLSDPEFANFLGTNGRMRITNSFTWDQICKKIELFYEEVIKSVRVHEEYIDKKTASES